ncbi:MAG: hypothetical protein MZW92_54080 [Comamonadaceae bacterium]|nr:hypothetical protein [Comamonadaceae bacterium]
MRGRRALRVRAARRLRRRAGRAAAVRRPDRLPRATRMALAMASRRLGLYGFGAAGAPDRAGGGVPGAARCSPSRGRATRQRRRLAARAGLRAGPATRTQPPPVPLDAALIFAPVGALVPAALRAVRPGGTVVCAGIHMSDIPSFPYALAVGASGGCARWPTSRARTATHFMRAGAPRCRCGRTVHRYPLARRQPRARRPARRPLQRCRRAALLSRVARDRCELSQAQARDTAPCTAWPPCATRRPASSLRASAASSRGVSGGTARSRGAGRRRRSAPVASSNTKPVARSSARFSSEASTTGVGQAAERRTRRQRAVAQAVQLRQAAGLEARRHERSRRRRR